jgi:uncharacterized protein YndB with AHSA1/START domain
MTAQPADAAANDLSQCIALDLDAPCAAVWRCWTERALPTRWLMPALRTTPVPEIEPRPGGRSCTETGGPAGEVHAAAGAALEAAGAGG